jgi:4-hydroxy-tetrahydrodipicolinate synthase
MNLSGLFVPLITPFDRDGAVDQAALSSPAHEVLDGGATGLVALGTTGEPGSLTPAERAGVLDLLTGVARDRAVPLIVGADDHDSLGALAGQPEVTAALTLVPPFLRPGEDGALAHLAALAAASPIPLVVYHVPPRTAQPLSPAALRRLATIDGVIGIKLATGGIDADTVDLMADPPAGLAVLGGDDAFIAPLLAMGAQGGIMASAHVATTAYAALLTGHTDLAGSRQLARLSAALFAEPNPTVIKGVLHHQGRIATPTVRLPLLPAATPSVQAALQAGRETKSR